MMPGLLSWIVLVASAFVVVPPPVAGVADYQLGGAYPPDEDVAIVTRDRTDPSAPGVYSICYVNAFQTQPGELGWWKKHHPQALLRDKKRRLVRDPNWRDEVLLDLRTKTRRAEVAKVVDRWFAGCSAAGFHGVEPDNLDSWTRSKKLMTKAQSTSFARTMVASAHRHGLAIAQKNTPELSGKVSFDFAVAEECEVYRECGEYTKVHGRRVIEIEYSDTPRSAYTRACKARGGEVSILLRDRDVVPVGTKGYVFDHC